MALTAPKSGKGGGIRLPGQPEETAATSALPSILTENDEELARRIAKEAEEAEELLRGDDAHSRAVEKSDREIQLSKKAERTKIPKGSRRRCKDGWCKTGGK